MGPSNWSLVVLIVGRDEDSKGSYERIIIEVHVFRESDGINVTRNLEGTMIELSISAAVDGYRINTVDDACKPDHYSPNRQDDIKLSHTDNVDYE